MTDVGHPVELGALLPPLTGPGAWARVVAGAERAEGGGAASVWLGEGAGDPVPVLSALARRVGVRVGLFGVRPDRRPLTVLAKELAGLDVIAHGRLEIAVGEAEPADVAESLEVLGGLMAGGPFDYQGRLASAVAARCLPAAAQVPHPPLWAVGAGDAVMEVAARSADGWMAAADGPGPYRGMVERLEAACRRAGRDPAGLRRGVVVTAGVPAGGLGPWAEAGASLVLAAPGS